MSEFLEFEGKQYFKNDVAFFTVMHTGTRYIRNTLWNAHNITHIHPKGEPKRHLKYLDRKHVFSTSRNPYMTVASWATRHALGQKNTPGWDNFKVQWSFWHKYLYNNPKCNMIRIEDYETQEHVGESKDILGLKKSYMDGSWDNYFSNAPRDIIDWVFELGCPYEREH